MIDTKTRNVITKEEEDYQPPAKYVISKDGSDPVESQSQSFLNSPEDVAGVINSWQSSWDRWSLLSVSPILGFASVATGCFINRHFRETLYLTSSGRVSSYLVMFIFPCVTASVAHYSRVSQRLFTSKEKCPTCTQVRAGITQLFTGIVYPGALVPIVSYALAGRGKHYNIPKLSFKKPTEILVFTREMFRPIYPKLSVIAALQFILSMGLTYYEQNMYYYKILPGLNARRGRVTPSSGVLVPVAADEFDLDHDVL